MDAQTTFIRTPMGREPAMVRMLRLSAEQRWLLGLIDGKRTVEQLEYVCSDLRYGHTALERLVVWGLIAPLAAPVTAPDPNTIRQAAKPQRPAARNDTQLLARLLAAKPVAETLLTRAALGPGALAPAAPNRTLRRA